MNSICDHAKSGVCNQAAFCDQGKPHDCGDYGCCIGGKFTCDIYPLAKCVPVETVSPVQKPKGSRSVVMKDLIDEIVQLKIKLHEFELAAEKFKAMPTMRRIVLAVKGGKNV